MPQPITPVGSFAESAAKLRRMLAESPTWQTACGASGEAEALESIYLRYALGSAARPLAIISPGGTHQYNLIAGGAQNFLRPSGSVYLYMAVDSIEPYRDDPVEAEFYAANLFGQVIDDIAGLAGVDDRLSITGMALMDFDETPEEDWKSLGRFWFAAYTIDWGDG